jgi:hypothetical protein
MAEVVVFPMREAPGVSWVNSINPSFCASRAGRRKENAKQFTLVSIKMSCKTSFIS